ncbi:MAG: hypothetical protein ACRCUS_01745 [Anaerovoracaceae bacterium]
MPKYEKKIEFYSDGFQDYTDYIKYLYNENAYNEIKEKNDIFVEVKEKDVLKLKSYLANFESWVKFCKYKNQFDFSGKDQIKIGDFYYLYDKQGESIGIDGKYEKYDYYDIYYYDVEKNILYFSHNNI